MPSVERRPVWATVPYTALITPLFSLKMTSAFALPPAPT
jgi:hypothetical protein